MRHEFKMQADRAGMLPKGRDSRIKATMTAPTMSNPGIAMASGFTSFGTVHPKMEYSHSAGNLPSSQLHAHPQTEPSFNGFMAQPNEIQAMHPVQRRSRRPGMPTDEGDIRRPTWYRRPPVGMMAQMASYDPFYGEDIIQMHPNCHIQPNSYIATIPSRNVGMVHPSANVMSRGNPHLSQDPHLMHYIRETPDPRYLKSSSDARKKLDSFYLNFRQIQGFLSVQLRQRRERDLIMEKMQDIQKVMQLISRIRSLLS